MPLQIRELHIRVSVSPGEETTTPGVVAQGSDFPTSQIPDKQKLIAECVEQVMELLHEKREP